MDTSVETRAQNQPEIGEAFLAWLKIGLLSFGGPAAQIALMHRVVVTEKKWLSEKQYLNALSFCMLLPGPEAMQIATYAGWRLHGVRGGLLAGLLFVIPGAIVIAILALIYSLYGELEIVASLFIGIKAAVIVVVIEALFRVAKKSLTSKTQWKIAILAFIGIFFLDLSFPLIILTAALIGFFSETNISAGKASAVPGKTMLKSTLSTIVVWLIIWLSPLLAVALLAEDNFLLQIGSFFSRLAVVTFGGAYAVLAYLGQEVVTDYGWLSAGEMMDGLGLAETTPGPLILVTEFVGFIAGFREGGVGLALASAFITLWVTFVPCFLWIFAGAPYIEWIADQPRLKGALTAITAAVVGVILNLSAWFALHVLFDEVNRIQFSVVNLWIPQLTTLNWVVVLLTVLCAIASFRLRWNIITILASSSCLGFLLTV